VYVTTSTEVAALDGRTGEVLWRTPLPGYGQGMLATDGRDLMLLSSEYDDSTDGRATVYDLGTGDETRQIPYPPGVSDVQLMHGLLVGWSYSTEGITILE
jgi:outer membrane protein assembly factor BamB